MVLFYVQYNKETMCDSCNVTQSSKRIFFRGEKCKIGQLFSFKIPFSPSLDPYVDL